MINSVSRIESSIRPGVGLSAHRNVRGNIPILYRHRPNVTDNWVHDNGVLTVLMADIWEAINRRVRSRVSFPIHLLSDNLNVYRSGLPGGVIVAPLAWIDGHYLDQFIYRLAAKRLPNLERMLIKRASRIGNADLAGVTL